MRNQKLVWALLALVVIAGLVSQIPAVKNRLLWGYIQAEAWTRGALNPAGEIPTPLPSPTGQPTATPPASTLTPTQILAQVQPATATIVPPTPTPLPASAYLEPPEWERQDINGCGPATLSMYLRYYGWDGDQDSIDEVIKPIPADRNVNVEELDYFVRVYAGWLNVLYRVGGDTDTLKALIAAGIPVMIEEGDELEEEFWPNDDMWAGHFLLLTGYDDAQSSFYAQDSFRQADRLVSYEKTDQRWKYFNRVYLVIFLPHQEETVRQILGADWDVDFNRQKALETAQAEIDTDPQDGLAWFNLGSNLVYFERYAEAAEAYDQARIHGLPQRMLRYQFGPYHAYYHTGRYEELLSISNYTLQISGNASEEALLWKGWALYHLGDSPGAIEAFRDSYWANTKDPLGQALYALEFMGAAP
ncbi:MAG: C39 family peptidase [Anaerolineales bacterium]|nr:C39 family peptidase [Anaerolineales bacterium]